MATTARSPSPNPSRPRTPDDAAAAASRKSCTSIPSSISEHRHQRNFGHRSPSPSSRRASIERNENGCSKSSTVRARSGNGSTKNFMAPTISASSKAVPASPRRRILAEKNEAAHCAVVRSSLTSLTDDSAVQEDKGDVAAAEMPMESSDIASVVVQRRAADLDIKKLSASGILSPFRFSPAAPIDPLDVDPSLPPYNPHTNYLSPRPRFLHYRPNPRIEQYHLDESGLTEDTDNGRRLEDSFTSESCEDTQGQAEEELSMNLQKDCTEVSSSSVVDEVMEGAAGSVIILPESESDSKSSGKVRSFKWYKLTSLLLVLAIACFFGSFMLKTPQDSSAMNHFHVIKDYLAASAVSLEVLGMRFGDRSLNIFAYYATSTLPREEYGPIFLANFTDSNLEQTSNIDYYHIEGMLSNEHISQDSEKEDPFEGEMQERDVEGEVYEGEKSRIDVNQDLLKISSCERDERYETTELHEVFSGNGTQDDTVYENNSGGIDVTQDAEENDVFLETGVSGTKEMVEEVEDDALLEVEESGAKEMVGKVKDDALLEAEESGAKKMVEVEDDVVEVENIGLNNAEGRQDDSASLSSASQIEQSGSEETPLSSGNKHEVSSNPNFQDLISASGSNSKLVIGFSSAVLLLVVLFAFLMKQKNTLSIDLSPPAKAKVGISKSVSGSSESHGQARGSPYENDPVDMLLGDSGPSEFSSSFQHSTSVGRQRTTKRGTTDDDTLSQERALRRDSEVSSSNFSFGSYTTYERLSAKKGNREEEAMTPVRRSSRIRNKIASP